MTIDPLALAHRFVAEREEARRVAGWKAPMPDAAALDRLDAVRLFQECETTLGFARVFWPVVEPARDYVHGWHIGCVAEHLDAVAAGELSNLIINVPPRTMKSLLTCVFWFCKTWTQQPGSRWMFASFSNDLISRDSDRCRDIVKHPLYRRLWPVRIKDTQDTRLRFTNNAQGFRHCVTTRGSGGMGEGADYLVIDDPQNPKLARSVRERQNTINWYRSTFSRRGNDERTVRKVTIMQRLDEMDLTGFLVQEQTGWDHLVIPMRYEPRRYFLPPPEPPEPPEEFVVNPQPVEAESVRFIPGEPDPEPAELPAEPPPEAQEEPERAAEPLPAPSGDPDADRDLIGEWVRQFGPTVANVPPPSGAGTHPRELSAAERSDPNRRPRDAIVPTRLQRRRPDLMDGPTGSGRVEEGDLLWPERFPEFAVAKAEEELGPDAPGQYGQRPTGESGDIYRTDAIRRYEPVWEWVEADGVGRSVLDRVRLHGPSDGQQREFKFSELSFCQTIDTALTEGQRSAYTACVTFFITPEFDVGLWHVWRGRANVQYQLPIIRALRAGPIIWKQKTHTVVSAGRWPFRVALQAVEAKASGVGLIQEAASAGMPFHPLKTDGDKVQRSVPAATMYANGKFYHPFPGPKWLTETEEELAVFPNGTFKDVADCIAYAGQLAIHDKIVRGLCGARKVAHVPAEDPDSDEVEIKVSGGSVTVEFDDRDDGGYGDFVNALLGKK